MPESEKASAGQDGLQQPIAIPPDAIPIVSVRNTVLFPGMIVPITLSAPSSVAAAQQAVREQRQIGVLLQLDPELGNAGPDDLYRVGTRRSRGLSPTWPRAPLCRTLCRASRSLWA
jgi:ATP-dependent Lon protease